MYNEATNTVTIENGCEIEMFSLPDDETSMLEWDDETPIFFRPQAD